MNSQESVAQLQSELGLKRLTPGFAKFEIVFGLAAVWAGMWLLVTRHGEPGPLAGSCALFVRGGYLAMAGSRSHLYQSSNVLAAYLAEQIRMTGASGRPDVPGK